jgi:hypothetical protein
MNRQQNMEERLWDYLDGACSGDDRLFIEQLIATNEAWKAKYQDLLELKELLSHHLELDEPSMRFNQNVMEAISHQHIAPAAKSYINKRIIWGITGFFICSIIGFIIACIIQVDWSAGLSGNSMINPDKLPFSNLDPSRFFNNTYTTIFMMINVVLGLVLLDMYLNRKKQSSRKTGSQVL